MFNFTMTPKVLEAVERALAKLNTPKQKRALAKRLKPYQGNSAVWCDGKGWLRQ
jgi:hypothetical protein